ncbi:MAG: TIR domain-containing protein [Rubrivivax sp.]
MKLPDDADLDAVSAWLHSLGLDAYVPALRAHHIDEWALARLDEADLREIGVISVGHRKRLMAAIAQRFPATASAPAPVPVPVPVPVPAPASAPAPAAAPALPTTGEPARQLKLFLSYGRDAYVTEVRALKTALEARGHQVWFDEEQLGIGLDWEDRIERGLDWCDRVVLTMTPHSVRRPDGYCLNELAKALERQKTIIPVLLTDVPGGAPTSICRIQYLDWRDAVPAAQKPDRFQVRMARLCEAIEQDKLDFEGGQQRLLRILQPLNYLGDIERHVARFHGRKALFERLRQWLDDPRGSQVLWLCGGSGLGKSAVAAMLAHQWGETGAVHFCVAGHVDKGDPRRAVLSIAYQLSTYLDTYRARLMALDLEREVEKDARALFDALLVGPLAGDFPVPDQAWLVVIDALDEATQADGSNDLAELVGQEWRKLPAWLRLAVTSQPDVEVQAWMSDVPVILLDGEDAEQRADVRAYLERELAEQGRTTMPQVLDQIVERSEGAFQYAVLLLEEIRQGRCNPEDAIELPRGMQAAYLQTFKRRFVQAGVFEAQIQPLLALMLASPDPTPLAVLADAVGITVTEVRRRLGQLGSMVSIQSAQGAHDPAWDTVRFAQSSLRSWLTSINERTRQPVAGTFATDAADGICRLATELLRVWDARGQAPVPAFVERHVFGLQVQVNDTAAQDRIALDVARFWEKRSLSLALAPAVHAAHWAAQVAERGDVHPQDLARAAASRHLHGMVLRQRGDSAAALVELRAALALWERLPSGSMDDPAHTQARSETHVRIAEIIRDQGDVKASLEEQRVALGLRESLLTLEPGNMDYKNLVAQSLNAQGNLLRALGDVDKSLESHHRALALREELMQAAPASTMYQRYVGGSHNNIGIMLKAKGDLEGALTHYQKFQALLQRLHDQEPDIAEWMRSLSVSHHNISLLMDSMGRQDEALESARQGVLLRERLVKQDLENTDYLRNLGDAYERRGSLLQSRGDMDAAMADYERGLQTSEQLAAMDPAHATWQSDLADSCAKMGGLLQAMGEPTRALAPMRRSLAIVEGLVRKDPGNPGWQRSLGLKSSRLSAILRDLGQVDEALALGVRNLQVQQQAVERSPKNTTWQRALANAHNWMAALLWARQAWKEAAEHARQALEIAQRLAQKDSGNADLLDTLATACSRLAQARLSQGELDQAQQAYGQAFALYTTQLEKDPRNAGWLDAVSDLHAELGWIQECRGDFEQALFHHQANLEISQGLADQGGKREGWQRDLALAHVDIARVLLARGETGEARPHLEEALRTFRQQIDTERPGTLIDAAGALALMARACTREGDGEQAARLAQEITDLGWRTEGVDTPSRARMLAAVQGHPPPLAASR